MPKGLLHLSIETDLIATAKNLKYPDGKPFNLSSEFEEFIKIRVNQITGAPDDKSKEIADTEAKLALLKAGSELIKPKDYPDNVKKELDDFAELTKTTKSEVSWRKFIPGRCRRIKHITGYDISQFELEAEIERRLK